MNMKKLKYVAILALILAFVSCSDDDDDGKNCKSCERDGVALSICDNGNGTAQLTIGTGDEQTRDIPEGTSFEAFADGVCAGTL